MKQVFLTLAFLSILVSLQAQTPKIAHKSHSGTSATFHIDGLNDFGIHPDYIKEMRKKREEKAKKKQENILNQPLKTKELEPLELKTKIEPIDISKETTVNKNKPKKDNTSKGKEAKLKNEPTQKIKRSSDGKPINQPTAVHSHSKSNNHFNLLWFALIGSVIIVGFLPVKK